MILTDDFVFIVFPKTGSAFAREALDQIHNKNSIVKLYNTIFKKYYYPKHYSRITVKKIEANNRLGQPTEHGFYIQVPEEFKGKKVMTIERNLFDLLVSLYTFEDWKKADDFLVGDWVKEEYPHYPNLNFDEFIRLFYKVNPLLKDPKIKPNVDIGPITLKFILFYFKDPYTVINTKICDEYFFSNEYKKDLVDLTIIDFKKLNKELYDFLITIGYHPDQINFLLTKKKTNVSRPESKKETDYYSKELIDLIVRQERYLMHISKNHNLPE